MAKNDLSELLTLEEAAKHLKIKHTVYLKQLALDNHIGFVWIDNKMLFTHYMIEQFIIANSKYPKYRPKRIDDIYDYLTIAETAELLKVSRTTIHNLITEGKLIGTFRIHRKICIPQKSIENYIIDCKNYGMKRPYYSGNMGY
jgi:excisionase family DNA binding protein